MIDNIIKAATCRISCGDVTGTGYLVGEGKLLTARHCILHAVEGTARIEVTFFDRAGGTVLSATIIDEDQQLDICLLSIRNLSPRLVLPLNGSLPEPGSDWRSFGFPNSRMGVTYRISGTIAQIVDASPVLMDLDLSVHSDSVLQSYHGLSGAPVVVGGFSRGVIRLKIDGTLGAISFHALKGFLFKNAVAIKVDAHDPGSQRFDPELIADRTTFQKALEQLIRSNPGEYLFIDGAHGIGKTTFCDSFQSADSDLLNLGCYCVLPPGHGQSPAYRAQPEIFFEWLLSSVSGIITGKPPRKEQRTYAALVEETLATLEAFSKHCETTKRRGVLFVDGLNEAQLGDSTFLSRLVGLLPQVLPQNITAILTAPNYQAVSTVLAGRVKTTNIVSLPPLSEEATLAYCWRSLKHPEPLRVAEICAKAKGHPLYLRYLIEFLNSDENHLSLDEFPILSGPIEQYYETIWARLLADAEAVHLLALMARLRWGIPLTEFLRILTVAEQAVFIPTMSRIRHLLLNSDETSIYHPSFALFVASKTALMDCLIHKRLADFCHKEAGLRYCVLNVVFHYLNSGASDHGTAVNVCDQNWVDACVKSEAEPDPLLSDVEGVVLTAAEMGSPVELFRVLLLAQRLSFRYNTLFAQSAPLIANALISLRRPGEALKHVVRFNNLIVDASDALQIAFSFLIGDFVDEAMQVLRLLYYRIVEAYNTPTIEVNAFINLSIMHLRTLLFMRLADGNGRMREVMRVQKHARDTITRVLVGESEEVRANCIVGIGCVPTSYFLAFRDSYVGLAQIRDMASEEGIEIDPSIVLRHACFTLLDCIDTLERYSLSKDLASLPELYQDIEEAIASGLTLNPSKLVDIIDALIVVGAPLTLVQSAAGTNIKEPVARITYKDENGVDLDMGALWAGASTWRIAAFLNETLQAPIVDALSEQWSALIEQILRALFYCEGLGRRAKATQNELLLRDCYERLQRTVLQPLQISLACRVKWPDSYLIPETIMPVIYRRLIVILAECFPADVQAFLSNLSERVWDQLGLYSEGFRATVYEVLDVATASPIPPHWIVEITTLLRLLCDHVTSGVDNRHELVPDLLKLIPLCVTIGAKEDAERLYSYMLSVSMGPTWYKEDQLGLMTSVLMAMPVTDSVRTQLPNVAAYLERASGEMTFQRFVRYDKAALIAEMFRRGMFSNGCRYFVRESCGTITELVQEWEQGGVDKPSRRVGMRHPGGAIDEQDAILRMIRNAGSADWRVCWALLTIMQCGDDRYVADYAKEYARLVNQNKSSVSEMTAKMDVLFNCELSSEDRPKFAAAFNGELASDLRNGFLEIMHERSEGASTREAKDVPEPDEDKAHSGRKNSPGNDEDGFYLPGLFGRRSAMREAEIILRSAESELRLGNLVAAKTKALKSLQALQEGGWSIWGHLSGDASRAEELLREQASNASEVVSRYASLLRAEQYGPIWRRAEHIFQSVAVLMTENERIMVLNHAVEHAYLMVGDASRELKIFSFLGEDCSQGNPDIALFDLVLGFVDHPEWLRRERAAAVIEWLVESAPLYFRHAAAGAFTMTPGHRTDVLCGVLDRLSVRQPRVLWDNLQANVDVQNVLSNCRHLGRLAVLQRIAKRGELSGAELGARASTTILGLFRPGAIELDSTCDTTALPDWAGALKPEWEVLNGAGLLTEALLRDFEQKLREICAPFTIQDVWSLEEAVSVSFREPRVGPLNRWNSKLRFALNCALLPHVSQLNYVNVESVLRIYNPSAPERTLKTDFTSPGDAILKAIEDGHDFANAIGDNENFFLNYDELIQRVEHRRTDHVEIIAVIVPSSQSRRGFFVPKLRCTLRSTALPEEAFEAEAHETCCRVLPELAFFGGFTPAIPLSNFLTFASPSAIRRINWRSGRTASSGGLPVKEGCMLSVKRNAVHLSESKKLAWIVLLNGRLVAMVDSNNNHLY